MQVFKINHPTTAYLFKSTESGNNLEQLSADVAADGGYVHEASDEAVTIVTSVGKFLVPIGFCLVVGNGLGMIISQEDFLSNYVLATSGDNVDFGYARLAERVKVLESSVGKLTTQRPSEDGSNRKRKSKKEDGTEADVSEPTTQEEDVVNEE